MPMSQEVEFINNIRSAQNQDSTVDYQSPGHDFSVVEYEGEKYSITECKTNLSPYLMRIGDGKLQKFSPAPQIITGVIELLEEETKTRNIITYEKYDVNNIPDDFYCHHFLGSTIFSNGSVLIEAESFDNTILKQEDYSSGALPGTSIIIDPDKDNAFEFFAGDEENSSRYIVVMKNVKGSYSTPTLLVQGKSVSVSMQECDYDGVIWSEDEYESFELYAPRGEDIVEYNQLVPASWKHSQEDHSHSVHTWQYIVHSAGEIILV